MSPTTADVPEDDEADMSPRAVAGRAEQGPLDILKLPDDDNPGLPPEVWVHPPDGHKLPE